MPNLPDLLINQHHVPSNVAEFIAFAKTRDNEVLTDNRLIIYILEAMNYGTKEQVTSTFIQKVFDHMKSIEHPFLKDLLPYEVRQIESAALTISGIQEFLWCRLLYACGLTTPRERAIPQLIIQYVDGDQEKLSALLQTLRDNSCPTICSWSLSSIRKISPWVSTPLLPNPAEAFGIGG